MMETPGREKAALVSDSLEQTLRHQMSTLTVALATLTEEKSKMETSFQADKRSLLAQQDSLNKQLQVSRSKTSIMVAPPTRVDHSLIGLASFPGLYPQLLLLCSLALYNTRSGEAWE